MKSVVKVLRSRALEYLCTKLHSRSYWRQICARFAPDLLITLQKVSEKDYYAEYFKVNAENVRKTWSDIKESIDISKSSAQTAPDCIQCNDKFVSDRKDM